MTSYLAVYSYENGTGQAILEQSYEQYLVEDITGGGSRGSDPDVHAGGRQGADRAADR